MINTNLPAILHRFRDNSLGYVQIRYWLAVLRLRPPVEGFPTSYRRKWYIAKD